MIGPELEAELIYLGPSRVRERLTEAHTAPLVVWDVGMGIAGNSVPLWKSALSGICKRSLEIHSFEKHPEALTQALENIKDFEYLLGLESSAQALLQNGETQITDSGGLKHRWVLHTGDFQEFLASPGARELAPPDLIYWDFYSPKTCPELWSLEIFSELRKLAPGCLLLTYSAATPVRVGLLLAGFLVGRPSPLAQATPMKSEATRAAAMPSLHSEIGLPLDHTWLEKLARSSHFRPYGNSKWATEASYQEIFMALSQLEQFRTT